LINDSCFMLNVVILFEDENSPESGYRNKYLLWAESVEEEFSPGILAREGMINTGLPAKQRAPVALSQESENLGQLRNKKG
jgi:hypothetical protein